MDARAKLGSQQCVFGSYQAVAVHLEDIFGDGDSVMEMEVLGIEVQRSLSNNIMGIRGMEDGVQEGFLALHPKAVVSTQDRGGSSVAPPPHQHLSSWEEDDSSVPVTMGA